MTDDRTWSTNNQNLTYRFNNGVPNQLTESIVAVDQQRARAGGNARLRAGTVDASAASRCRARCGSTVPRSWFPAQQEGPSRFLPTPISFPETDGVNSYKDITPRLGVAYDVFGNGKTAIKANIGKYLEGVGFSSITPTPNPTLRLPADHIRIRARPASRGPGPTRTATSCRTATCRTRRAGSPRDAAAISAARSRISASVRTSLTNNYDPALLNGWGVRSSDWNLGASIQQQLLPRASVEVAYSRRWYHGFTVTDNLALSSRPTRRRTASSRPPIRGCPAAAATRSPVCTTSTPPCSDRSTTSSPTRASYGNEYQYFNGVDITLNVRSEQRPHLSGRHQHRPDRGGRLRRASEPARSSNREPRRRASIGLDRQHHQPVLPRRLRRPDAGAGTRRPTSSRRSTSR